MNASIESNVSASKSDPSKGHYGMQLEPDANFAFTVYTFWITYGNKPAQAVGTAYSINPDATKFPIPAGFVDGNGKPLANGVEYLVPAGSWPPAAQTADGAAVSLSVSNQVCNWGTSNPMATSTRQGSSIVVWQGSAAEDTTLKFYYDLRKSGGIAAEIAFVGTKTAPSVTYRILASAPPAAGTFVVSVNAGVATQFPTRTAPTGGTWYAPA